ncbi:glutathione-disulfide reductase [Sphingomonas sp. CARO-RG-8B-R24-01]|uniref:glutathione-disulfide reductase n=1 Tax=Sphingomonas sp. CARO-RG-8B-R24-01 TaxID=2914831 RepID=UPI001F597A11
MEEAEFDLFVIGAGSGGVRAAKVAAAHGARVGLAEEFRIGGTCVIRGCVPKKMLFYGSHFAEDLKDARRFGWDVPDCAFDWITLRDNVLDDVRRLERLYTDGLEHAGVSLFHERATLSGPQEITLSSGRRVRAGRILIATGAQPARPICPGAEHGITSNEAFGLEALPKRIVVVGGGYIANEFAGIFNELGSHVTLICRSHTILQPYDPSVRDRLLKISMQKGIVFCFNAVLEHIDKEEGGGLSVYTKDNDPLKADLVLFAVGRRPNSANLGLKPLDVRIDPIGAILVDEDSQTSVPSIFAIGDVTNRIQLTPVAIREGQAFADTQFGGKPTRMSYDCVSSAVFSHPPIAAVGLTEEAARALYGNVKVYSSDFRPLKNVLANRRENAFYKMVCDDVSGRILGLHMIGPEAPEILQAAAIAVKAGITKTQFEDTMSIFPTMAEELIELA